MNLSVCIPAYNEEDNIEAAIRDVVKHFPDSEIIVVNDASTDQTAAILSRLQVEFSNLIVSTNESNKGHGYTVCEGLTRATKDYILYIDADRQIDLDNVSQIKEPADIISGYRLHRNDKLFRKIISFCLKATNLVFHRMYIKDANCPFKLYRRQALWSLIAALPTSYVVPIACLEVLARKRGLKTITIPTPHHPYQGVRQGFLQSFNLKLYVFLWKAFWEVVKL